MAQSDAQNAQRTNAISSRTINNIHAVGAASMAAAARSEAARHAGAQAFAQHMGDQQTVMDPTTGQTAQVSNQYNHTYYDQQTGQAMQTNGAGDPGASWTELQVVPPRLKIADMPLQRGAGDNLSTLDGSRELQG